MWRWVRSLVWIVAMLSMIGAAVLAGASDAAASLRTGPSHHRALAWTGVLLAISFFGGAIDALAKGSMTLNWSSLKRYDLTPDDNPAGFFYQIAIFLLAGLIAVICAAYQFRQT